MTMSEFLDLKFINFECDSGNFARN